MISEAEVLKLEKRKKVSNVFIRIGLYAIIIFVLFCLFVPLFFMLISMFKDRQEIFSIDFHIFPYNWTFDNFSRLFYLQ